MKKLTTLILVNILVAGCTFDPMSKDKTTPVNLLNAKLKKPTHRRGEINFVGDVEVVKSYFLKQGLNVSILDISPEHKVYQARFQGDIDVNDVVSDLKSLLQTVEPNYFYERLVEMDPRKWPTDKYFFRQWYLNNVGQSAPFGLPGKRGADVNVLKLWQEGITGSKKVRVGIVDTGIDYNHPDLKDNMWINDAEKKGVAGKDDDGNGYVDDIYGYDFVSGETNKLWYGRPGDPDPADENGHGTHCAGVIGARANNDEGIAGLNQNIEMVALKIFPANGGAVASDIMRAIYYGINKKVDILSNSWGGGAASDLVREAIEEANRSGILFVAASGNDGKNTDVELNYPSTYRFRKDATQRISNILAVGASDNQDNPADFSNYGHETVDIFAPGVAILSTYPTALTDNGRPYVVMSGTSMSTPIVTGVAALVLAANPSLKGKPAELKRVIIDSADEVPSLVGKAVSNGRVNAYKAAKSFADGTWKTKTWVTQAYNLQQRGFNQELVDIRHKIQIKGAKALKAHFNFVQVNEPYDSIYFYDSNLRFISAMDKIESVDAWSPIVPGDTLYVRFVNAKLKTIKSSVSTSADTESKCNTAGGIMDESQGSSRCRVDTNDSSSAGSELYNSFNSEGFSIDQVSFVR